MLSQQDMLRYPYMEHHLLRCPEARACKLEGYCAVVEDFFILNGLAGAGDRAVVYLFVCVELVKEIFVFSMECLHQVFKFSHLIPLSLFEILYGCSIADTGEQMRGIFRSTKKRHTLRYAITDERSESRFVKETSGLQMGRTGIS